MNKSERCKLAKAISLLEENPMRWEDGMTLLYSLLGAEYPDWRKISGKPVNVHDLCAAPKQGE